MPSSKTFRLLLLKEGNSWAAQCLEVDIASQGDSIKQTINNFCEVVAAQVASDIAKSREPLSGRKEAPHWYWQYWDELERSDRLRNQMELKLQNDTQPQLGFRLNWSEA
jgi:hypothetical protein